MAITILNSNERHRLERLCNTRSNWTDGGHWMGPGKARYQASTVNEFRLADLPGGLAEKLVSIPNRKLTNSYQ